MNHNNTTCTCNTCNCNYNTCTCTSIVKYFIHLLGYVKYNEKQRQLFTTKGKIPTIWRYDTFRNNNNTCTCTIMYMYAHVSTTVILHLLYTQINYMSTCTCILPSGRLSVMILFVSLPKDYRIIKELMQ